MAKEEKKPQKKQEQKPEHKPTDEEIKDEICRRAEAIYKKRCAICRPGDALYDWLLAEKVVKKKYGIPSSKAIY